MGLINNIFSLVFGDGRNVIAETAHVFRENAEAGAARDAEISGQVMQQYAQEFGMQRRGVFDTVMDAINRVPRPAMALGTLGLFVAAMVDPEWFAARMQGIALVPEPLWWLLGAIVSFYFGARHQFKGQEFQRSLAATLTLTPQVIGNLGALKRPGEGSPGMADSGHDAALGETSLQAGDNPALEAWRQEARSGR